jgi:predicted 3-demethylubiquinone-9 3-methyltransferase (glyoxalase superfamily)
MQKVNPFLWFSNQAEEAVNFYASVFKDLKINHITRNPGGNPEEPGSVLTIDFELFGQHFVALNGGPGYYEFTPAISFIVRCESQAEVDQYWDHLLEGGSAMQCGWLTDKYGLTWQIIPNALMKLMGDANRAKAANVMQAMMKMIKLDIQALQQAYDEA